MFCDSRIKNLCNFTCTDPKREHLHYIHFQNGEAIATNGSILARVKLWPTDYQSPLPETSEPFDVHRDTILAAFKNLPKKARLPIMQGVFVSPNAAGSYSDIDSFQKWESKPIDGPYPEIERVYPMPEPTDITLGLGKKVLQTLISTIPANGTVKLRIKPPTYKPWVTHAITYSMHGDSDTSGVLMPCTCESSDRSDYVSLYPNDITEMLSMLSEFAPNDERTINLRTKYKSILEG